jgi:N-acyl amino acid synthase of PEP-CTERM/exosortase system
MDEYDVRSIQGLLIHKPTGDAMGTVRMVRPDFTAEGVLPVGQMLQENGFVLADYVPLEKTVEVSRFAISKFLRRRSTDDKDIGGSGTNHKLERIRQGNLPCLSLIQFLVRQSMQNGVTHWAAVMEVKLLRMLQTMGIEFTAVGPLVVHHGLRQPCYADVRKVLVNVKSEQPDYWKVITDGGSLSV